MGTRFKKMESYFKKVLHSTGLSVVLFIFLTILSYFLNLEYRVNFKLGLPWTFYDQFFIDCDLHHGATPINFIKDALATWACTTILWLIMTRKK
jgi:hypothetical protein